MPQVIPIVIGAVAAAAGATALVVQLAPIGGSLIVQKPKS